MKLESSYKDVRLICTVSWLLVVLLLVKLAGPLTVVPVAAAKKVEMRSPVDDSRLQDKSNISGSPYRAGNYYEFYVRGVVVSGAHLIDFRPGIGVKAQKLTRIP